MNVNTVYYPLVVNNTLALTGDQLERLEKLEKYDLWFVIERLEQDNLVSKDVIAQSIVEFKRYIALRILGYKNLAMCSHQVDEVWHNLILFTKEYETFCQAVASEFIHHSPRTSRREIPSQYRSNFIEAYKNVFGSLPSIWNMALTEGLVLGCQEEEPTECN